MHLHVLRHNRRDVQQLERRDIAQQSKVEDEEEGMEGDEENEDDVSEKSDSEENSEKSNPEHSDEGSDGGETDLELRRKVEEALRVDGIELTTGATDSEEEELMDDEQMMAIDERLAEVFRSRANEKKKANGLPPFPHTPIILPSPNIILQESMRNVKLRISKTASLTSWTCTSRNNTPIHLRCGLSRLSRC